MIKSGSLRRTSNPAGPADTGQTLADVVVGQLPAALLHDGGGRQGDGRVVQLVVAEQRQLQTLEALQSKT